MSEQKTNKEKHYSKPARAFYSYMCWTAFACTILFYLVPIGLWLRLTRWDKTQQRERFLHYLRKSALFPLRFARHFHVEVDNHTAETFSRQAVIICNHQSVFEILAIISLVPKLTVMLKSGYKKNILLGSLGRLANYHFVSNDFQKMYGELEADIRDGYSLLIFPEGTRTRNGELGEFNTGAFSLAQAFGIDILPMLIRGAYDVMPKGHSVANAGTMMLEVLPRIKPTDHLISVSSKRTARRMEDYYREMLAEKPTACVIGGGMGGLFTAALLSRAGYRVTVLEKNTIIGGGLQSFQRAGKIFNTGMHNFGGWGDDWALKHLFRYFGIADRLQVMPMNEQAQEVVWTSLSKSYSLPRGRQAFEDYLSSLFPSQAKGIHDYLDDIRAIANSFDHYMMRRSEPHPEVAEIANLTVDELIRKHIDDEELIRVLSYMTPLCGQPISKVPVSVHSMLSNLYIDGAYRFVGGSLQLATAMAEVVREAGGIVIAGAEVDKVEVGESHIEAVETTDHRRYEAESIVAAIPPKTLFALTTKDIVRPVSRRRADNFMPETSAFSIYLTLKPQSFPFINSSVFIPLENADPELPPYILLTTPPEKEQGEWAETMEILLPVYYSQFEQWEDTKTMHRGEEYEQLKLSIATHAIEYISKYYPQLGEAVDKIYTASPLTIRDYYNNPNGAIFAQQGLFMPLRTRTDNLYFTGQSILYHGLCGVPLTAILTAESITQQDLVTEIRNNSYPSLRSARSLRVDS